MTAAAVSLTEGRQGVYEVMTMSPRLRRLILQNVGAAEIRDAAVEEACSRCEWMAWLKILKGLTTTEQILRETSA